MEKEISVIVPFCDDAGAIGKCVDALNSQTIPKDRFEIIMVDNNSRDGSAGIVRKFPGIKLVSEPKQGAYAARNRGLAEAGGMICAFTDADCVPFTDWLEKIEEAMRPPDVGIVQGGVRYDSGSTPLSLLAAYEEEKMKSIFSSSREDLYYAYAGNMAVRKKIFDRLGPFQETGRGADSVFMNRAVKEFSCDIVRYSAGILVLHSEIKNVWKYYEKQFVYGRSNRRKRKFTSFRSLTPTERFQLYQKTIRNGKLFPMQSALLFLLIGAGAVCYRLGQMSECRR